MESSCIGREAIILELLDSKARIVMTRSSACGSCNACSMMGGSEFSCIASIPESLRGRLSIGDKVMVELPTGGAMRAAFIMYVIPLLILFTGIGIGYILDLPELVSFLIGILAFALYFIVVRINKDRFESDNRYSAIIQSKIGPVEIITTHFQALKNQKINGDYNGK